MNVTNAVGVAPASSGQHHCAGATLRLTVEVPAVALPPTVHRRLLDRLTMPLSTGLHLSHAGRVFAFEEPVDWSLYSAVHATVLPVDNLLGLDNVMTHPAVATAVVRRRRGGGGGGGGGRGGGMVLTIHDDVQKLGSGAFGLVYRGTLSMGDQRPSVQVAVKQFYFLEGPHVYDLYSAAELRPVIVSQLLPEMNTLLRLVHPNLVRLRCVGIKTVFDMACPAYVAMELCDEGTLRQRIDAGRVSDVDAVSFMNDLVSVMSYLHVDMLVVHRDLKPDNIFVRSDVHPGGRAALILGDLGLAKVVTGSKARVSMAGTPLYLAPEAAGGGAMCSLASDVYSASLVAVEFVSGQCVHNEHTAARDAARADELAAKAKARMTELLVFADDVPLSLTACDLLLGACTHVAPTDRPSFRMIRRACNVGGAPAASVARGNGASAEAKVDTAAEAEAKAQAEANAQAQGRLKRGSA